MGDGYVHQESVDKEVIKWGKYFIAKYRDTGKIAAIMALKFARAGYLKGKLVLRGSITVPEFRRQGLQKEMQYAVLESLPIKYVYSQVAIDNVNMIQMTKSMGYKLIYSDKKYNYYRINSEEIR
jgi:RimJ/RimL family protein N-acetyltransferase